MKELNNYIAEKYKITPKVNLIGEDFKLDTAISLDNFKSDLYNVISDLFYKYKTEKDIDISDKEWKDAISWFEDKFFEVF